MEKEKIAELFMKKHIRWLQDLAVEWESVKPAVQ